MDKPKLFLASCVSLVTTAMVFAIRGDIATAMAGAFHLTNEQLGLIFSPAFWAFTIAIFISGALVDVLGMRRLHIVSAVGYVVGVLLVILAPRPAGPVSSLFDSTGTTLVYAGFFIMGLSQGLVEGVINPLIATIYSDRKTRRLNMLHAWWPGGMIIGGLLAYAMTTALNASWELKLSTIMVPAVIYLFMAVSLTYPRNRARGVECLHAADVGRGRQAAVHPALRLHVDDGGVRARPRSVVPDRHGAARAAAPGRALPGLHRRVDVRAALLLQRLGPPRADSRAARLLGAHRHRSVLARRPATGHEPAHRIRRGDGLRRRQDVPLADDAWRDGRAVPRGGALLISLMGGAGMLSVAVALPIMGARIDRFGPGAALQIFAIPTAILVADFWRVAVLLQGARRLPRGATAGRVRWRASKGDVRD